MSTGCLSTYRGTTFDMLLHTKVRLLYPSIFDMSTGCLSTYRGTTSDMLLHTRSPFALSFDIHAY